MFFFKFKIDTKTEIRLSLLNSNTDQQEIANLQKEKEKLLKDQEKKDQEIEALKKQLSNQAAALPKIVNNQV